MPHLLPHPLTNIAPPEAAGRIGRDALKKVKTMLKSTDVVVVTLGIELLRSLGASQDEYLNVFTTKIARKLIKTWNLKVWEAFAELIAGHGPLTDRFSDLAIASQFYYSPYDNQGDFFAHAVEYAEHSRAIVERLLSRRFSPLHLDTLASLSDVAAKSLSKYGGDCLALNGVTSLSDAAAESLSSYKGYLSLDGLTSLSDAAAESLSRHKAELTLNGLTSVSSDAAAESLSRHTGSLELNGLTSLSEAAAQSLGTYRGSTLSLQGLTNLSHAAAASLSRHSGVTINTWMPGQKWAYPFFWRNTGRDRR